MRTALRDIAAHFPVSFHSVGLSLGNAGGLNHSDLDALALLAADVPPVRISDHLSWTGDAHDQLPDLLPIPYTLETLALVTRHVDQVQQRLGMPMLIENPSRVLAFSADMMHEVDFLEQLTALTGCALLLDINNIVVSATNLGEDPGIWLDAIDPSLVREIHLAGHTTEWHADGPLLIDDHGSPVGDQCLDLFARFIERAGPVPTLIEWDTDVPSFAGLLDEARRVAAVMAAALAPARCAA